MIFMPAAHIFIAGEEERGSGGFHEAIQEHRSLFDGLREIATNKRQRHFIPSDSELT